MATKFVEKKASGAAAEFTGSHLGIGWDDADAAFYVNPDGTRRKVKLSAEAEVVTATNVIAASENGKTFYLDSTTEFVSTLPAPFLGGDFTFIVKRAPLGASYTVVTASSANVLLGHVVTCQDAGGTSDSETSGGDTYSFVDGKAVVGDRARFQSDGTSWFVSGVAKVYDGATITTAS